MQRHQAPPESAEVVEARSRGQSAQTLANAQAESLRTLAQSAAEGNIIRAEADADARREEGAANAEHTRAKTQRVVNDDRREDERHVAALGEEGRQAVLDHKKAEEDRVTLNRLFDHLGDCVAVVESEGRPQGSIRRADDSDVYGADASELSGVSLDLAVRYHTLSTAVGRLTDLRNEFGAIRYWTGDTPREEALRQLREASASAKPVLEKVAARAEREVLAARARWVQPALGLVVAGLGIVGVVVTFLGLPPDGAMGGIVLAAGSAAAGAGAWMLRATDRSKARRKPVDWSTMQERARDVGPEPSHGAGLAGALIGALAITAGVGAWAKASGAELATLPPVQGTYTRDGVTLRIGQGRAALPDASIDLGATDLTVHQAKVSGALTRADAPIGGTYKRGLSSLTVEPGFLSTGSNKLPVKDLDVEKPSGHVDRAVVDEGMIFDDTCTFDIVRNGPSLTVTMSSSSDEDCNTYAGEWTADESCDLTLSRTHSELVVQASGDLPACTRFAGTWMPSAEGVAGAAAPSTPNTPCEKVKGTWSAQVAADVGWNWGKDRPTKALIVEGRSVKVWASLTGSEISGDGWVAWNMNAPTEQEGACVYTVHDTVYGEGFNKDGVKPYDVVRTVTLTPADGGIDMKITHDPPVFVAGGPAKAVVEGWFKAFDGSFWKDAPPELKSGTR